MLTQVQQYLPCRLALYKERQEFPTINCTGVRHRYNNILLSCLVQRQQFPTFTCTGTGATMPCYLVLYKVKNYPTFTCTDTGTAIPVPEVLCHLARSEINDNVLNIFIYSLFTSHFFLQKTIAILSITIAFTKRIPL